MLGPLRLPLVFLTTLHLKATPQGASGAVGVSAMVSGAPGRSGSSASKTKSAKRHGSDPKPAAPPAGRFGYLSHSSPDQLANPFFHDAGPSPCEHGACDRQRNGQRQYRDVLALGTLYVPLRILLQLLAAYSNSAPIASRQIRPCCNQRHLQFCNERDRLDLLQFVRTLLKNASLRLFAVESQLLALAGAPGRRFASLGYCRKNRARERPANPDKAGAAMDEVCGIVGGTSSHSPGGLHSTVSIIEPMQTTLCVSE